jgi:hypothetical protein
MTQGGDYTDEDWMPWGQYGPDNGSPLRLGDLPLGYVRFMAAEAQGLREARNARLAAWFDKRVAEGNNPQRVPVERGRELLKRCANEL